MRLHRSVRGRSTSVEEPNKIVMTVADSPKKRNKRGGSPLSLKRIPIQFENSKSLNMPSNTITVRTLFDQTLGDKREIQAYGADHDHLLQIEFESAWDRGVTPKSTSRSQDDKRERDAAAIIRAVREFERKDVFGNQASEAIPGPETRDMGGQFLTNKPRIDTESLLYKISQQTPKGCLLHLHFNAELHPEKLLERARDMENMYIRSIRPLLTEEDLDLTEMVFNVLNAGQVEKGVDIFSPKYPGNATNWKTEEWKWRVWMPWKTFRAEFDKRFGKKWVQKEDTILVEVPKTCSEPGNDKLEPVENWLKSKMVLSEEEAYGLSQTVNG